MKTLVAFALTLLTVFSVYGQPATDIADTNLGNKVNTSSVIDAGNVNIIPVNNIITPGSNSTAFVTLTASTASVSEAAGTSTITATLSDSTFENVTVNLGYTGTATNSTDYNSASSITVLQGQLTGSTTLTSTQDVTVEANETVIIDITSTSGGYSRERNSQQQTITINDDDVANITLTASSASLPEASGASVITATSDKPSFENIVISLGYSGTATNGTDYGTGATSITIIAGQTTASTTLTATQDIALEGNETLIVDITGVSGGSAVENGIQQQTLAIVDDESTSVTLSLSGITTAESSGVTTVTATLAQPTFENVIVSLGYSGTATNGTDYATGPASITITAGQTTGSTTLTATEDTNVERDETIIVDITGVSGGSASENGNQQQTVTITDNDTALVTLTANAVTLLEASGSTLVTATLDLATFENVTVNLGYSGTATNSTDYATGPTSITIIAGQTTGTATLTATQDTTVEGNETIIVDITGVTGGKTTESGTQQQTVTITDDDDALVTLTASTTSLAEASGSSIMTATLDKPSYENITVSLGYTGTATHRDDYAMWPESITVLAGQLTGSSTLTATQDTTFEPDETIVAHVIGVTGGRGVESGTQLQTLTIVDDESTTVFLSLDTPTMGETGSGTLLTATLTQPTFENVIVTLGYSGTAINGTDYSSVVTSITILAGRVIGTAVLPTRDDTLVEDNETVIIDITNVSGGSASENGTQQQTLTIIDDDSATIAYTQNNRLIVEEAGTTTFTFTLSETSFEDVVLNLSYSGDATSGIDYIAGPSSVTILAGQPSASITYTAIQDTLLEGGEIASVTVTGITGSRISLHSVQSQSFAIIDDESTTVSLSLSGTTMTESDTTTITATLAQSTYEDVTVNLGYSGTATNLTDYSTPGLFGNPPSITITKGQTTGTITIDAIQDNVLEGDESLVIDISSVVGGLVFEVTPQQKTITLVDDEKALVTLSVDIDAIVEGIDTAVITATLDQPTFEDVIVGLDFSGTSINGIDYVTGPKRITIVKGQIKASTTLTAKRDTTFEGNESIIIDIATVSGGNAIESGLGQQTITIIDNSTVFVTLSTGSESIAEAAGTTTLTANLDQPSVDDVIVSLNYLGTAQSGIDYTSGPQSITITAGQTSSAVSLTAIQDNSVESDEIIIVTITDVSGGRSFEKDIQQQSITIEDDDTVSVSLSVSTDAIDEAEGFNVITATIDRPIAANVTFNLGYTGTAIEGADYETPTRAITIEPGQTTQSAQLTAREDTTKEGAETVLINITGTEGVNVDTSGVNQQSVTITDNDEVGPAGYGVTIDVAHVNSNNQNQFAFTINNAQDGKTYQYTISDKEGSTKKGTGEVTLSEQPVGNIDVATLVDGPITLTLRLTDAADLVGSPTKATAMKKTKAPIIELLSPRNNAVTVGTRPTLTIDFDVSVNAGSSDNLITVKSLATNTDVASFASNSEAVIISGNVVNITLSQDLMHSTGYYVTIPEGAFTDTFSNVFGGFNDNTSWQFRTANPNLITTEDTVSTHEDNSISIDVLGNDVSLDSSFNRASLTLKKQPSHGTIEINTANGLITYKPKANFNGADKFKYQVMDLLGNTSAPVPVDITVFAVNDAPQAQNDVTTVLINDSVTIDVLSNDMDIDGKEDIELFTLTVIHQPAKGQTRISEGKISYQPISGYQGSDSFAYTVSDKSGLVSNVATVSVNVAGDNQAPTTKDDVATTDEDVAVTISVLDNDQDVNGNLVSDTLTIVNRPANGIVKVEIDGALIYTPALNFSGKDNFSYTIKDNQDAVSRATVVAVTVNPLNDAPVANDDIAMVIEDAPFTINVMANDSDVDSRINKLTIVSEPERGTVAVDERTMQIVFNTNSGGADSFSYELVDTAGAISNAATVKLTLEALNNAPLSNNDSVQTVQSAAIDINVLSNDSDIDGSLNESSVQIVNKPQHGTVEVQSNGHIIYTPETDFAGDDEFVYQVSDDQGAMSSATVSVRVNNVQF